MAEPKTETEAGSELSLIEILLLLPRVLYTFVTT